MPQPTVAAFVKQKESLPVNGSGKKNLIQKVEVFVR